MRARIKFTTDSVKETLVGILKEHHWWPEFEQESEKAQQVIDDIQDSVEDRDTDLFTRNDKIVLFHTPTESSGALSLEHNVWVVRILNPNVHMLQMACESFVSQYVSHATRNHKNIIFAGPIQIVERKRKETIIEGRTLATPLDRRKYARSHRCVEFLISRGGMAVLFGLLLLTFPWSWRDLANTQQTWLFSVFEKFIGSVAVTTLISYVQYQSFLGSLQEHSIRWSIPGEPEKLDVQSLG
ncbi:MAG: hypothetical protein WCI11_19915 [Candidatus Methylumidiphilus sp.]